MFRTPDTDKRVQTVIKTKACILFLLMASNTGLLDGLLFAFRLQFLCCNIFSRKTTRHPCLHVWD